MWEENSTKENDVVQLLGNKPKSYYTMANKRKENSDYFEETVPLKQSFNEKNEYEESYIKEEKPDGGWGWMVVFGVALSNMTTQSLISVFGLLFIQKLSNLGITTGGASIMMGVQITTLNLSGLITGPVMRQFSYRKTSLVGSFLVISGLLLTTHADSLPEFIFTYSFFTGLGLGLLYPSTFVAINSYFSTKRGRAVGLSVAGTGIGQMLLPLLVEYLLDNYGFNGTLLILAGLASHSVLGATLYQPVKWHKKRFEVLKEENIYIKRKLQITEKAVDLEKQVVIIKTSKKRGICYKMGESINLELLGNLSFLNLLIGLALVYTANMCFSMLLPFFLENVDYSRQNIAYCMSVLSGADIIGRLIVPFFTDSLRMKSKTVFFCGAALSALTRSSLMFSKDFSITLILASACGVVRAALICNFNLSITEQTITEKLPSALGLHMFFKGMTMMAFAPLIGFVRDYTKSYVLCMHILSIFFLMLPFFAWFIEFVFVKFRKQ